MVAIARLFGIQDDDEDGMTGALIVFSLLSLWRQSMTKKK